MTLLVAGPPTPLASCRPGPLKTSRLPSGCSAGDLTISGPTFMASPPSAGTVHNVASPLTKSSER